MSMLDYRTVEEIENLVMEASVDLGNARIAVAVANAALAKAHREKNKAFDALAVLEKDMRRYLAELEKRS